tara:strand:+ start:1862 stop:2569 length:708 start_codon:yes stop_codon:yes gene_type:complete
MALPVLDTPKHKCILPSTGETVNYRPFLVGEQKVLLVAQESENANEQISEMIRLINICCDDIDANELATIDLEYLFLQLRIKSVGETADIQMECEHCNEHNKVTVQLDQTIVEEPEKVIDNVVKITDTISIDLKTPSYQIVNSVNLENSEDPKVIFEVVSKCINSIIDGDEIHTRDDFSDKELMSFLDSMSMDMFEKIQAFFVNVKKLKINGSYDCEKCEKNNSYELMGIGNFFG